MKSTERIGTQASMCMHLELPFARASVSQAAAGWDDGYFPCLTVSSRIRWEGVYLSPSQIGGWCYGP
jgi:hypothetical protein